MSVQTCVFSCMQEFEANYSAALKVHGQRVAQRNVSACPRSFRATDRQATTKAKHGRREKEAEGEEGVVSLSTESEEYLLAVAFDYEIVDTSLDPLETIAVSVPVSRVIHVCLGFHSDTINPPSPLARTLAVELLVHVYPALGCRVEPP